MEPTTFEDQQSERMRARVRVVVGVLAAIWLYAFLFVDPTMYGSRGGKLGTRLLQLGWSVAFSWYLRRRRSARGIELGFLAGAAPIMVLSGASLLHVDQEFVVFSIVSRLAAVLMVVYLCEFRLRTAVFGYSWGILSQVGAYVLRDTQHNVEPVLLSAMWWLLPIPVFAVAGLRRERAQREAFDLGRALAVANERLRQQEASLRRLFVHLSHDLRTPLQVIRGEADELATKLDDAAQRAMLARVADSTEYMADLVEQLLELSRVEAGRAPHRPCNVQLDRLASEVAGQLPLQGGRDVRVELQPVVVHADPLHLRRIVTNLVGNARRHVDPVRGEVTVRLTRAEDRARLEVTDNGPGVEASEREQLFRPFALFRREGAMASGIGLPLAYELAVLNGASLALLDGPGPTTFRLELPAVDGALDGAVDADADAGAGAGVRAPAPRAAIAAHSNHSTPAAAGKHVLLVEDNQSVREQLERALTAHYRVSSAATLAEAEQRLADGLPDLMISDVMLPDGRGTELVAALRQRAGGEALPVICISALADVQDRVQGLMAGADDYVPKPFAPTELLARAERALLRAEQRRRALDRQRDELLMELHDGVCAAIARASLLVAPGADDEAITHARQALAEASREARGMLGMLESRAVPWEQAVARLRRETADACAASGLAFSCELEGDGEGRMLSAAELHALARVAREATTNTIKHAGAKRLVLKLGYSPDRVSVAIEDDGRGFEASDQPGYGRGILARRCARLGGEVRFERTASGGARVAATLPLLR